MNKFIPVFTIIVVLINGFLISCASVKPKPVYLLEPVDKSGIKWQKGSQLVSKTKDNIRMDLSFKEGRKQLVFDLAIENSGRNPILFDPSSTFYCASVTITSRETLPDKIYAINPETRLTEIMHELNKLEPNQAKSASASKKKGTSSTVGKAVAGILGLAVLAGGAHKTLTETEEERAQREAEEAQEETERKEREEEERIKAEQRAKRKASLLEQKAFWENECLRKSTIDSGTSRKGKLLFPIFSDADTISLNFNLNNKEWQFNFKQKKISCSK